MFAQPDTHAIHRTGDRVLAHLQPRILAQQRHVLRVGLQPGDARGDLLRRELGRRSAKHDGQTRNDPKYLIHYDSFHCVYLHHLMKNN